MTLVAAAATDPAPWWGVPVVAGAFLILGGLLTFVANWRIKGRELRQAEISRWDKDILDTSTKFLEGLFALIMTAVPDSDRYIPDMVARGTAQLALNLSLSGDVYRLTLIAPQMVSDAARELHISAEIMVDSADLKNDEDETYVKHFDDRREAFIKAVRIELRSATK
jgi:hypothetical protein